MRVCEGGGAGVGMAVAVAALVSACGAPSGHVESATIARSPSAPSLSSEPGSFVARHSSRLHVSVPLPDGAAWLVDDRSTPDFVAEHPPTESKLVVHSSIEPELMNRAKCEERAQQLGLAPTGKAAASLKTVESANIAGPDELDTRIWVALEPGVNDASPVTGYVFAFGAHMHKCMTVRYETRVASASDGEELSARLALVRSRVIPAIHFDNVLESVPRESPALPRRR